MCLSYLKNFPVKKRRKKDKWYTGWKCIRIVDNSFNSYYHRCTLFNTWLTSDNINLYTSKYDLPNRDYQKYQSGFHIFLTRSEARIWKNNQKDKDIVKVRYTKIVAKGIQNIFDEDNDNLQVSLRCVIAKKMYVEKPK